MKQLQQLSSEALKSLRFIFFNSDATRLELIDYLQASHLTVSNVIKQLLAENLIFKSGKKQGESGRPSTTYRIAASSGTALGVHFDFNTIRFVLIDTGGGKLLDWEQECAADRPAGLRQEEYIGILADGIQRGLTKIETAGFPAPFSICVSLPGMVDSENGTWISGLQLQGIRSIPLKQELEIKLSLPVFIEDNSRSLVILEKVRGAARGYRNIVLLYLGVGMGAGIVIDNRIVRGVHGTAGEIGHIPHGNSSYRCSCGNIGCFETVVSPYGIKRIFSDRLNEGVSSSLQRFRTGEGFSFSLEDILEAADNGDHLTIKTLAEIGDYIGDACDILIKLFNPEVLIITGFSSIFAKYLRQNVETTISMKIAPEISRDFQVIFPEYKPYFEAWGAGMVAIDELVKAELGNRK